ASSYNVVRRILGRDQAGDDVAENKYTRAASALREWEEAGALTRTSTPAWFPYQMRFQFQGRDRVVRGLICQVRLEPWGRSILPHEQTLTAPFEDRLSLLRAVRANLSPVYALFRGPCQPLRALIEGLERQETARRVVDEE